MVLQSWNVRGKNDSNGALAYPNCGIPQSATSKSTRLILLLICVSAFLLRLLPHLLLPSINQPDEIFQTLEPAHRLVFGSGVTTWEFLYGARSYLLPGVFAALMWISRWLGDGPAYYLPLIFGVLAALSTCCVYIGYLWGSRRYGTLGGLVAACVVALSADAIYFGPRAGPEEISAHFILIAIYLIEPGYYQRSRKRLFFSGILFGLAVALRIHVGPVVGLAILWTSSRSFAERFPPLLAGALLATMFGGLIDWFSWSYPFESTWQNLVLNIGYDVGASYGKHSWHAFITIFLHYWGAGASILILLALIEGVRFRMLLALAMLGLAEYLPLAHIEFRFFYLPILFCVMLAALGMAHIVMWLSGQLENVEERNGRAVWTIASASIAFWLVFSVGESFSKGYGEGRMQAHDSLEAALAVSRMDNVCGVGVSQISGTEWAAYTYVGGYTYLHNRGAIFNLNTADGAGRNASKYNILVYDAASLLSPNFHLVQCFNTVCVAQRSGTCLRESRAMPAGIPLALRHLKPKYGLSRSLPDKSSFH